VEVVAVEAAEAEVSTTTTTLLTMQSPKEADATIVAVTMEAAAADTTMEAVVAEAAEDIITEEATEAAMEAAADTITEAATEEVVEVVVGITKTMDRAALDLEAVATIASASKQKWLFTPVINTVLCESCRSSLWHKTCNASNVLCES